MLKILLPTDFSLNAWNAISYAMEIFKDEECKFYILHTYTPAFYRMDYLIGGPSFSAIPDVGVDVSVEGLEKTLVDLQDQFPNPKHNYETVSAFNLLTDEVNDISREKDIDLIVMGTQGATGAKEIFLGTNTVYVIRKARIPVLVIPQQFRYKKVKKILFPTDFWSKYKEDEFKTLIDTAQMCNANVTVLHVKEEYDLTENQEDNKQYLKECLQTVSHQFKEIEGALMPNAIIDYIDEHGYELLVMMNRKHSFLERLMWRQNVDQIGFQCQVPFLVIRDTAKISK